MNTRPQPEELTLRELLLSIKEYFFFFLKKWYFVLILALILGGIMAFNAYSSERTYSAPITFTVEGSGGGGLGAGSILGQLGLGGSPEKSNAMKLLELSKSRLVVKGVLFDSLEVDGKEDLLANHLILKYGYHEKWEENEKLRGYLFKNGLPKQNDRIGNLVFKQLQRLVAGPPTENALLSFVVNELTGIFYLEVRSVDPVISIALAEKMYAGLEIFHVSSSTRKHEETFQLLQHRSDSVEALLSVVERQLAYEEDRGSQITLRKNNLARQKLSREVLILSTLFVEILKNKETASFLLANEKPTFVIIDAPLEPLQQNQASMSRSGLLGAFGGMLIASIILFFYKLLSDALNDNLNEVQGNE